MSCNPEQKIQEKIAEKGSITIDEFISYAMYDPNYGYYTVNNPFGKDGDFITSPLVSQMFGEMIGLWCVDFWNRLGFDEDFNLVECGAGDGTMMSDILRATQISQTFMNSKKLHIVETSKYLQELQASKLSQYKPTWHKSTDTIPQRFSFILANELLDAFPVKQFIKREQKLLEKCVKITDSGNFYTDYQVTDFANRHKQEIMDGISNKIPFGASNEEEIIEFNYSSNNFVKKLCEKIKKERGIALLIDYGYEERTTGNTLQALYKHNYCDIFDHIGKADITSHVDFYTAKRIAHNSGLKTHGCITQGEFLTNLGIKLRAKKLINTCKDEHQKLHIISELDRLISPSEMGKLFKVMCIYSPEITIKPAGFD